MDHKQLKAVADGFNEEFMRTIRALMRGDGFLAMLRHKTVAHMAGTRIANVPLGGSTKGLMPVTATMQLPFDVLETGDSERLIDTLKGAAREMKSDLTRHVFARMDEVAEQHNMVVDDQNRPFSADVFVEMLEKLDIDFDEEGNAIMPSLVVHPSTLEKIRSVLEAQEAQEKIEAVLAKKKKAKGL